MVQPEEHSSYSERGFSLIELLIVIAIIAIGSTIATLGFNDWQNKSRAEAQVKQMVTDFNELRLRAMTNKQPSSVTLNANNYVLKAYTSIFQVYTSVDQQKVLPDGTRTMQFQLNKADGTAYNGEYFEFDERGMSVSSVYTIFLGGSANKGALDCLTVHTVRINVGKNTGTSTSGVCNDR